MVAAGCLLVAFKDYFPFGGLVSPLPGIQERRLGDSPHSGWDWGPRCLGLAEPSPLRGWTRRSVPSQPTHLPSAWLELQPLKPCGPVVSNPPHGASGQRSRKARPYLPGGPVKGPAPGKAAGTGCLMVERSCWFVWGSLPVSLLYYLIFYPYVRFR